MDKCKRLFPAFDVRKAFIWDYDIAIAISLLPGNMQYKNTGTSNALKI